MGSRIRFQVVQHGSGLTELHSFPSSKNWSLNRTPWQGTVKPNQSVGKPVTPQLRMTQTRLLFIRIIGFPWQLNGGASDVFHPDSLLPNSSLCLRRRHPSSSFLLMISLFHAARCLSRASPFVSALIPSVSLSHSPAERRATFLRCFELLCKTAARSRSAKCGTSAVCEFIWY